MSHLMRDLTKSQLFLDDTWIDDQAMLTRRWHKADIYPEPIFRPEMPWEGTTLSFYGTVFKFGDVWRMYYTTANPDSAPIVCVAESEDGMRWTRPVLNLHEYRGSKANNITMRDVQIATICHDPEDADAPFKMLVNRGRKHGKAQGLFGAVSKDGFEWTEQNDLFVGKPPASDVQYLWSRKVDGKYVIVHKTGALALKRAVRTVAISESDDFKTFSKSKLIIKSDLTDPADIQYHGMVGFPYADMYLGVAERWVNVPNHIELLLVWSHDRVTWHLPATREPIIGPTYPWNKGWNTCSSGGPIQVGNQLRFYFGAQSDSHNHVKKAGRKMGVVGLAEITLDRFASITAAFMEGQLITKPMLWPGGDLMLNASTTTNLDGYPVDGGGAMFVEVWDEGGQPVEGWAGAQRAEFHDNAPSRGLLDSAVLRWPGGRSLNELAGRRIRLVFYMRGSHLFSFRAGKKS